jgi:hypothetical protein
LGVAHTPEPAPPTFAEVWIRFTMITGLRPSENRGAAIEDLVLTRPRLGSASAGGPTNGSDSGR